MYSRNAVNFRIIQLWFFKFISGDFLLTNKHYDDMLAIINANLSQNIREIDICIALVWFQIRY